MEDITFSLWEENDDSVIGYMCMIDYECELGIALGGNRVFPSLKDLKQSHPSWEECGIVEVKILYNKTICDPIQNKLPPVETV